MIGAEHPRYAGVAGELVALVDRRDIDGIPSLQHRAHRQALARCDRARQNLVAFQRQLLGLLAGDVRLGLGVERLDLDFAAGDATFGIGLGDSKFDSATASFPRPA